MLAGASEGLVSPPARAVRFQMLAVYWRSTAGPSDAAMAALIGQNRTDANTLLAVWARIGRRTVVGAASLVREVVADTRLTFGAPAEVRGRRRGAEDSVTARTQWQRWFESRRIPAKSGAYVHSLPNMSGIRPAYGRGCE